MKQLLTLSALVFLLLSSCLPKNQKQDEYKEPCYTSSQDRYDAFIQRVNSDNNPGVADSILDTVFFGEGVRAEFVKESAEGKYGVKKVIREHFDLYYTQLIKDNIPLSIHGVLISGLDSCYKIVSIAPVTP